MRRTDSHPHIAYEVIGDDGPPVLLCMGFGMRGEVWQPQVEGLVADHRLAYFDNRGVGESERPRGWWSMADMADDARRVLDAIGWERAHVVGVSMGGMVAQELALAHPDRVASLALIATHAGGPFRWLPTRRGIRSFLAAQSRDPEARTRALMDLLHPREFVEQYDPDKLAERMRHVGNRAPLPTLLGQLGAIARHDTRARLHRLRVPTLVVRPGADILVRPDESDRLAAHIARAELLRLDDGGHGVIFQHAGTVNAALRRHFAQASAS